MPDTIVETEETTSKVLDLDREVSQEVIKRREADAFRAFKHPGTSDFEYYLAHLGAPQSVLLPTDCSKFKE